MDETTRTEILDRLIRHGLLYEEINLSGKVMFVHEATGHTSRKMGALSLEVESAEISEDDKDGLFSVYIPLMSCSEGDLPPKGDYESFWFMKQQDIETWVRVARKINPQLFGLLDAKEARLNEFLQAQEDVAEKKSENTLK